MNCDKYQTGRLQVWCQPSSWVTTTLEKEVRSCILMKRLGVAVLCGPEGAGKSTGVAQVVKQMLATGEIKGARFVRLHNSGSVQSQVSNELGISLDDAFVNYIEEDENDKRIHVLVIDQIGHGENPDMDGFDSYMEDLAVSSFNSLQDHKAFMVIAITSKIDVAKRMLGLNGGVKFYPLMFGSYMLKAMRWDETQIVSFCSKLLMESFLMEDDMIKAKNDDESKKKLIDRYCDTLKISVLLAIQVGTPQFCQQVVDGFFEIVENSAQFTIDEDKSNGHIERHKILAAKWKNDRKWEKFSAFAYE